MCMEVKQLNRTHRPLFNFYHNDGWGRDTYISYNNGGLWRKKTIPGTSLEQGHRMNMSKFNNKSSYTLREQERLSPIFKYTCDGSGRDSYVIFNQGGLVRNASMSLASVHLKDFLRISSNSGYSIDSGRNNSQGKALYLSKGQKKKNALLKTITGNVIQRLYSAEKHKFLPKSMPIHCSLSLRKKLWMKMPTPGEKINIDGYKPLNSFKKMSHSKLKDDACNKVINSSI